MCIYQSDIVFEVKGIAFISAIFKETQVLSGVIEIGKKHKKPWHEIKLPPAVTSNGNALIFAIIFNLGHSLAHLLFQVKLPLKIDLELS